MSLEIRTCRNVILGPASLIPRPLSCMKNTHEGSAWGLDRVITTCIHVACLKLHGMQLLWVSINIRLSLELLCHYAENMTNVSCVARFMKEWLTNGYDDKQKIEEDYECKVLTKKKRDALMAVHDCNRKEAIEPSAKDLEFLNKIYRSTSVLK